MSEGELPLRQQVEQLREQLERQTALNRRLENALRTVRAGHPETDDQPQPARVFRALAQVSPALIFSADSAGALTYVNDEKWIELSGRAARDWTGNGWLQAFHPSDRDRAEASWNNAVEQLQPFRGEYRWRQMDGRNRWLLLHAQPVFEGDQLTSYVGTGTDVTALKTAERERATLHIALAESQKMEAIGTLASGVAHDFNNFLAAVRGYVELARLQMTEASVAACDKAAQFLTQAETVIDQAKDVTSGLLTFSRGSSAQHGPLCLNQIIADNVELLRQLLPAPVHINCDVPEREIWISGDATQLRQVLINLLINSRDALAESGGDINVTLRFAEDQWAALAVRDSGRGMSSEAQERALEPFFTTKKPGQGTGLGLSVVHGIVTAHGGELEIRSEVGVGTEVEIRLPLSEGRSRETKIQTTVAAQRGRQHILLVEDHPLVRDACARRLEANGYSIVSVESGEDALQCLQQSAQRFDLVLLDVDLPGADGVHIAAQMRELSPDLKVIFITGNISSDALQARSDTDPVLPKPIDYNLLFAAINNGVESPA